MATFVDDAGRQLAWNEPPDRIVSLVPSLTELVCDLGLGERLVGVTRYCTEPAATVANLPRVGGTKNPDVAAIVRLRPKLVLVNSEENRIQDFQALAAADLPLWVSFPRTLAEAASSVARLGAALGAGEPAGAIARDIAAVSSRPVPGAVRVFCPIWRNPWMSFNSETFAGDLIRCAGGANLYGTRADRYPVVDLHEIARCDPEVILLPDEPYRFTARHVGELGPLRDSSACRNARVHLVDGKALSWYGRRTAAAVRAFAGLLAA